MGLSEDRRSTFQPTAPSRFKGKQEGRVIGDLSGQQDPTYIPLNGTAASKETLRAVIATQWGEIRHPTVVQLVLMVLTAADVHGWDQLILSTFSIITQHSASYLPFLYQMVLP